MSTCEFNKTRINFLLSPLLFNGSLASLMLQRQAPSTWVCHLAAPIPTSRMQPKTDSNQFSSSSPHWPGSSTTLFPTDSISDHHSARTPISLPASTFTKCRLHPGYPIPPTNTNSQTSILTLPSSYSKEPQQCPHFSCSTVKNCHPRKPQPNIRHSQRDPTVLYLYQFTSFLNYATLWHHKKSSITAKDPTA